MTKEMFFNEQKFVTFQEQTAKSLIKITNSGRPKENELSDRERSIRKKERPFPKPLTPEEGKRLINDMIKGFQSHGLTISNMVSIRQIFHYAVLLRHYKKFQAKSSDSREYCQALKLLHPKGAPFVIGNVGSGKTTILEYVAQMAGIQIFYSQKLLWEFCDEGLSGMKKWLYDHQYLDIIIDDLGAEEDCKSFGNGISIKNLIDIRYENFRRYGSTTAFTSNCNIQEISKRYGIRICDRISEMVYPIVLNDTTHRIFQQPPSF